jgi:gamma-glutamylputrescine oxidase
MFSYWEQQSFLDYDHIVVGAGIVGLNVAIELRQHYSNARILVLERGLMTTGASSRNAGFACMGSATELLDDLTKMTEDEVLALFDMRKKGLSALRQRLGDRTIDYVENGSYELIHEDALSAVEQLDFLNKLLLPITGKPAFLLVNHKIKQFGFSSSFTKALIENTCEGGLNTGKMLRALTDLALQLNIEIKTGASVDRFEEGSNHVTVFVPDLIRNDCWALRSKTLSICTNAFAGQLLPHEDVVPGRGQVLITKPIAHLKFKGIYHFDEGYYYFREINGSVLIGGGRNLDIKGETTTDLGSNDAIQRVLMQYLQETILPGTLFEVEQCWSGIMAFGATKMPIVKAFSNQVFGAFRMGGMGVALGTEIATDLVNKINDTILNN